MKKILLLLSVLFLLTGCGKKFDYLCGHSWGETKEKGSEIGWNIDLKYLSSDTTRTMESDFKYSDKGLYQVSIFLKNPRENSDIEEIATQVKKDINGVDESYNVEQLKHNLISYKYIVNKNDVQYIIDIRDCDTFDYYEIFITMVNNKYK